MDVTTAQYDVLEAAIANARRLAVWRRGTEYLVIPHALRLVAGREALDTRHPNTGDSLRLWIDEIDRFELVR